MHHEKTTIAAKGKWRGILATMGVPEDCLKNRHGPCPICESKNNFRFDDKDGSGSYICTCGAGTGMDLAMSFTGKQFKDVATEIDLICRNVKPSAQRDERPGMTQEDCKRASQKIAMETKRVVPGDLADKYLRSRGLGEIEYPYALRFGRLRDGEGGIRPTMVALVGVHGKTNDRGRQSYESVHRTFLRPDGLAKAEMDSPRKLMPGKLPEGSCIMLSDYFEGPLGIAEGIETAMSATALFGFPCWAAINTSLLSNWLPPEGCKEVIIFADNDGNHAGHKAAYALSHRLRIRGVKTTVRFPDVEGMDWNDVLMKQNPSGERK